MNQFDLNLTGRKEHVVAYAIACVVYVNSLSRFGIETYWKIQALGYFSFSPSVAGASSHPFPHLDDDY